MSFALDKTTSDPAGPQYAEVAVPLHVSQTFTYRLPEWMRGEALIGSRILVPLGRNTVAGYIVGFAEELKPDTLSESGVKDAENLLDSVPICTQDVLEITRWVSDYYGSPWGEVIKAALPPGISPTIRQFVVLTDKGKTKAGVLSSSRSDDSEARLLLALATTGELAVDALSTVASGTQIPRLIRQLEQQELISRVKRPIESRVKHKQRRAIRLLTSIDIDSEKITNAQNRVLEILTAEQALLLSDVLKAARVGESVVRTLARKGIVEIFDQSVRRDPLGTAILPNVTGFRLTEEQSAVLTEVERQLRSSTYGAFLLHGVTGSGKTEVYIRAMRTALELGRSAMMLVPEIALTPVFSRRLRAEFSDQVAIFHSSLPAGERFDEWTRVKTGEARVVIGTRSAVFAPAEDLGLVIVDEEHESSYRQQDSPYYHGRDTAIMRAQKQSATVILGSATPSLESFQNSRSGKYRYLSIKNRIGNRPMAEARLVDMRNVFARHGRPQVFSDELLDAIRENQQRSEQTIILLNRRGFSSFVLCRSCGETMQCPNCDVTLTYHRSERVLVCHYCNHRERPPSQCPVCDKNYIHYVGEGTEQIEHLLTDLFPDLRIARIDRDTSVRRRQFEKSLLDFGAGQLDMLVGTQMLAKGHDFQNVTLVGVVSVDAGLALPDFRAAERTFQLITQVAGRAGRGDLRGRVLIQSYHPDHYALRHACAQDYEAFYAEEIRYRQNHMYPPFVALALLLLHGNELGRVRADAAELRKELDRVNKDRVVRVLGPAPAPLARLKGEHRIQILIKSRNRKELRKITDLALDAMYRRGLNPRSVNLEIDPVSIM